MESKGLFFVIVLALVVIAVFVYLGLKTYKELKEAPAKEESAATAAPARQPSAASPRTPDFIAEGRTAYSRGDYAGALDAFKKVIAANPDHQVAKELAGGAEAVLHVQAAMLSRNWNEALIACSEAAQYSISALDAKRRTIEIGDLKAYYENYDKARQAAEQGDYTTAYQAYTEARRLAVRLGITSDAGDKAKEMQATGDKAAMAAGNVNFLLNLCAERNDPYAIYAAATYYLAGDLYKSRRQELKSKLDMAGAGIATNRNQYPSPRVAATLRWDVVEMKTGTVEKGEILSRDEKIIKLRQDRDGKAIVRTLIARDVAGVKQEVITPEEANDKRAEALLTQAVIEMETKHLLKALSAIGVLLCEFPDMPLMKDAQRQQAIITAASVGTALKGGVTFQKLLEMCMARCEVMCSKCEGAGRITCPECKGAGSLDLPCPSCNGAGKTTCLACNGQCKLPGMTPNSWVRCGECGGRGSFTCAECKGKKTFSHPCTICNGAKTIVCFECTGGGLRPGARR